MTSPYKRKPLLTRPFIALRVALEGLAAAWVHEVPFRLEVLAAAALVPLALWLGETGLERAALIGSVLLVLIVELVNAAVETALDRISLERHPLAKRAKDIASAAVAMSLLNAAVVWGLLVFG